MITIRRAETYEPPNNAPFGIVKTGLVSGNQYNRGGYGDVQHPMKRESELHLLPTSQRTQCAAIRKTGNSSVGSWITLRDSNGTGINVLGGRMLSAVDMAVTTVTTGD